MLAGHICQRAGRAVEQLDRAQVDILIKIFADGQQQIPQRDVIRYGGIADCAEEDRIEFAQLFDIFTLDKLLIVMAIVVVSGLAICVLSTYRVVNKLVSLSKDELYY